MPKPSADGGKTFDGKRRYSFNGLGLQKYQGVLVSQEIGSLKIVGAVDEVATVCLKVITQRPVNETPATEPAKQQEIRK